MKSMHVLLDEAEHEWREDVRRDFPLHSDTPVVKTGKLNNRDWEFYTDLNKIFSLINNDDSLKKKFETVVTKYWKGSPDDLARATLKYLLNHELYHPLEAPFSVDGDHSDNKLIHQAIRKGVLRAEPALTPLDQLVKVHASQNGVKDFILDNRFYLDNKKGKYVQEDIIPVWDLLELQDSDDKTNFYTITRFLYGVLYGPQSTYSFFQEKAGKDGANVAEKALGSLVQKTTPLPKEDLSLLGKATKIVKKGKKSGALKELDTLQEYSSEIRKVFSSDGRYKGIERLMSVLGPYVQKDMPQGRPDQQGDGSGTSPQNILQDLLDDMTPSEQSAFINSLSTDKNLAQMGMGKPGSISSGTKSNEEYNTLDVFSIHEFYKRNHPNIKIIGGSKTGESVVVDNKEYWHLKKSEVITEDNLSKINLRHVARFQQKTGLPVLIPLENHQYRLNEYEIRTKEIKDIKFVDETMDVPDIVEFYLDSSGSMYGETNNFGFNDGSSWDMLSNVIYGYIDALYQGGKVLNKKCSLRVHNFANSQKSSEIISVEDFLKGNGKALTTLFKPENGYGHEDICIQDFNDGLKRSYVVVTDGNLVLEGRTEREAKKMKKLAKDPNNKVLMFEIGGEYALGTAVKNDPNIFYTPVYDKNKMLQDGIEVLLSRW